MKNFKKIIGVTLIMIMILSLVACGKNENNNGNTEIRTFTDMSGRTIEISGNVDAYAVSWIGAADVLAMLDGCKGMVAYPKTATSYSKYVDTYIDDTKMVMLPKENISAEEIINTDAKVVFARLSDIEGIVDLLEKAGVLVVDVEFKDYDEMLKATKLCADILGTQEAKDKADRFVQYGENTLSKIDKLVLENRDNVKATALAIRDTQDYRAYGPGRYAGKWMDICGFTCPLETDDPEAYVNLTPEEIAKYDTDFIFFAMPDEAEKMSGDSKWNGLKAYNNGTIYNCPECYNTWCNQGCESLLQLYWACSLLYPDKVDYEIESVIGDFYKEFYGLNLSSDEIDQMLNQQK